MKVLLAIDGSEHSQAALDAVAMREWPDSSEIKILTVVHSKWPLVGDPLFTIASAHAESILEQRRELPGVLERAAARLRAEQPDLPVTTMILEGVPHDVIVEEAERWEADLIVLGSHGYGPVRRALLGSVAAAVAVEAPCAVEIIRRGRPHVRTTAEGHVRPQTTHATRSSDLPEATK
jgi:nucleotide-binding universal stress UspA family protein